MAKPGDELINPYTGHRLVFRRTTTETEGAFVEVDAFYAAGSSEPVEHLHPYQEERFEVVAGAIHTRIQGVERTYGPGEAFVVPPGIPHAMHNAGPETAHLIWRTSPALQTEAFFETLWGLAQDGRTNRKGVPNLLQMAVLSLTYGDEFRLTRPPRAVQRVVFGVLAPVGWLLGYRGRYPRYSPVA